MFGAVVVALPPSLVQLTLDCVPPNIAAISLLCAKINVCTRLEHLALGFDSSITTSAWAVLAAALLHAPQSLRLLHLEFTALETPFAGAPVPALPQLEEFHCILPHEHPWGEHVLRATCKMHQLRRVQILHPDEAVAFSVLMRVAHALPLLERARIGTGMWLTLDEAKELLPQLPNLTVFEGGIDIGPWLETPQPTALELPRLPLLQSMIYVAGEAATPERAIHMSFRAFPSLRCVCFWNENLCDYPTTQESFWQNVSASGLVDLHTCRDYAERLVASFGSSLVRLQVDTVTDQPDVTTYCWDGFLGTLTQCKLLRRFHCLGTWIRDLLPTLFLNCPLLELAVVQAATEEELRAVQSDMMHLQSFDVRNRLGPNITLKTFVQFLRHMPALQRLVMCPPEFSPSLSPVDTSQLAPNLRHLELFPEAGPGCERLVALLPFILSLFSTTRVLYLHCYNGLDVDRTVTAISRNAPRQLRLVRGYWDVSVAQQYGWRVLQDLLPNVRIEHATP